VTIQQDVASTWHDAIIELFELDLSGLTGNANDQYYFANQLMPDNSKVQWKGKVYEPLPIEASGFERTTKGQLPQPELTVSNAFGSLAAAVNSLNDLVGAKVTRRRTLLKYLDNGSFPDPSQEFPEDEFYIERKVAESSLSITWSLASKIDLEGLKLPKRIITQNYCLWKYRGTECGYTGPAVSNEFDQPISIGGSSSPEGAAYIAAYEAFKTAETALATAEAKKNNLLGQKEAACDPNAADVEQTLFVFKKGGTHDYTFAIQDGDGNTIVALWDGVAVDVNAPKPQYRPNFKQRTNRGPGSKNNGTGAAYTVANYVPAPGGGVTKTELPFSTSTFAIKDYDGAAILFIGGAIVPQRTGTFGYDIGDPVSAGFAPMRSMAKLDYNNTNCSSLTSQYNAAVSAYDAAKAAYDAAKSALDGAFAALPVDDEVLKRDQCGKRLQSCRLRFGATGSLPFGGFPGANLTR